MGKHLNIGDKILETLNNSEGLVCQVGEKGLDGPAFIKQVEATRKQLKAKVPPQKAVLLYNDHTLRFWVQLTAIWAENNVAIPVDESIDAKSLNFILEKSQPVAMVRNDEVTHLPANQSTDYGLDSCLLLFTSGSTGTPKGAELTHEGLWENAIATQERVSLPKNQRLYMGVPSHFVSAISHFLVSRIAGAALIADAPTSVPGVFLKNYEFHRANAFGGAPIQLRWLAQAADFKKLDLHWAMSSGDHLAEDILTSLKTHYPQLNLYIAYGLTELSGRFCIRHWDTGTGVGTPIAGFEAKLTNGQTLTTDPDTMGEIWVRSSMCTKGYLNDPVSNKKNFSNGWFRTGDMAKRSIGGDYILVGRKDDVFKCMGLKVSTLRIEEALMNTGYFQDVCVRPLPNANFGHIPVAFYVPKTLDPVDMKSVNKKLKLSLPQNHLPKQYTLLESIPRTPTGKIRRREFDALISEMT